MPEDTLSNPTPKEFAVELHNETHRDNEVPFAVLASVLNDMQQAFYLLALQHEGRDVRERARIPAEIERRYILRAAIPKEGSYAQPATLGDPNSELFVPRDLDAVYSDFREFSTALATSNLEKLQSIVPDRQMRRRVLERFRSMIPKPNTGWGLRLRYEHDHTVELDRHAYRAVAGLLKRADDGIITTNIVTGVLVAIDFDAHEITLKYPPSQREFVCYYNESIEGRLIDQRRELIQITGSVTLDEDDSPKKVTDVVDIVGVDLSPFIVMEFEYEGRILRFRRPLEITPTLDESQQVICLEYEPLGIDIYASTRDELDTLIYEELDVLWRNYALEDPRNLSLDARELKSKLLAAIEEIGHAA
ncbi:MAG: hypothetical protein JST22_12205 [Bacteroidetes bacterium]|nr:hypothetical protein [Bacteroidota bacterium]